MATVTRGCGSRTAGGLYLEIQTNPNGVPLNDFLLDPAIRVGETWESKGVKLSPLGVQTFYEEIEGRKIKHIIDIVGKEDYPNLTDFIEELNVLGLSRKLSSRLDLSGISKESQLYMIHDKAWVKNIHQYKDWICNKGKLFHKPNILPKEDCCCSGIWWQDLDLKGTRPIRERMVQRIMPISYVGYVRPEGVTPSYERGIFAIFPLSGANLAVINGHGSDQSKLTAQKSELPIRECEE